MIDEVARSDGERRVHLVNPKYESIGDRRCFAALDDIDEPVDLVLLGVGDNALAEQLGAAARIGARGAVVFGAAHGASLRDELRAIAAGAGLALCGPGCMGFVNVADGLRATGYLERPELPRGPIALVTHSGSVFSALLRTRRALGFELAVSSGQELVTTTADYLEYVLDETDATLIGLVLETVRDGPRLIAQLQRAAARDIPVVVLPVGGSPAGAALVTAHSGALAGSRAGWEALADATGVLLVSDLAELTDTLELLAIGRRARPGTGIATVHDSGAERSLVADLADELAVPFAPLSAATLGRLASLLDPGVAPGNPLDLWGGGADTREIFGSALRTMADDPAVSVVALAVDLVEEYDGDTSYPDAVLDVRADCDAPLVVLANVPSAVDEAAAARLRAAGVPVLEGTRSGLVALRHLLTLASTAAEPPPPRRSTTPGNATGRPGWPRPSRSPGPSRSRCSRRTASRWCEVHEADDESSAVAAARAIGYPVVLKTDAAGVAHKSDVGGVALGLADEAALRAAYRDIAGRLGPRVLVCASARGRGRARPRDHPRPAARAAGRRRGRRHARRTAARPGGDAAAGVPDARPRAARAAPAASTARRLAGGAAGGRRTDRRRDRRPRRARPRTRRRPGGGGRQSADRHRGRRARGRRAGGAATRSRRSRTCGGPRCSNSVTRISDPRGGPAVRRRADPARGRGRARRRQAARDVARRNHEEAIKRGLYATNMPTSVGGPGATMLQQVLVQEQVGRVTNGLAWVMHTPPAWWVPVATDHQKERGCFPRSAASGTSVTRSPRSAPGRTSTRSPPPRTATATRTWSTA